MHCPRCGANMSVEEFACTKCGYLEQLAIIAKLKAAKPEPEEFEQNRSYARFWKRCSALILDFLFLIVGVALLAAIIGGVIWGMSVIGKHSVDFPTIQAFTVGFGIVFAVALSWAYFTGFESSKYKATLGKKLMGLLVVDKKGKRISFGRANIRYWGKIISILIAFAGFWMMGFTKKKRTLHDLFAGTLVLNKVVIVPEDKPEESIGATQ
jgi:uncharacterized RDD family membrane protein YckC